MGACSFGRRASYSLPNSTASALGPEKFLQMCSSFAAKHWGKHLQQLELAPREQHVVCAMPCFWKGLRNTLDEPVMETIMRDLRPILRKSADKFMRHRESDVHICHGF